MTEEEIELAEIFRTVIANLEKIANLVMKKEEAAAIMVEEDIITEEVTIMKDNKEFVIISNKMENANSVTNANIVMKQIEKYTK